MAFHDRDAWRKDFNAWREAFESSPAGKAALLNFNDLLDGRVTGNAHESPNEDYLKFWILRGCYNATTFRDASRAKRDRDKVDIPRAIHGEGRNQKRAIEDLRQFIRTHPPAAGRAIARARLALWDQGIYLTSDKQRDLTEVMDALLAAYWEGLKQFTPAKGFAHWSQSGCLSFPAPLKSKRKATASDSLIFELALLIRRATSNTKQHRLLPGTPLPTGGRIAGINQVIAELVNATLGTKFEDVQVKRRVDALLRQKAEYIPWTWDR